MQKGAGPFMYAAVHSVDCLLCCCCMHVSMSNCFTSGHVLTCIADNADICMAKHHPYDNPVAARFPTATTGNPQS